MPLSSPLPLCVGGWGCLRDRYKNGCSAPASTPCPDPTPAPVNAVSGNHREEWWALLEWAVTVVVELAVAGSEVRVPVVMAMALTGAAAAVAPVAVALTAVVAGVVVVVCCGCCVVAP